MPTQPDCFDEFLRKVDPLMYLYQSLEFACVAARREEGWILMSGKAVLTTEPLAPGPRIPFVSQFDNFVARSGRTKSSAISNLVTHLRDAWVIEASESASESERIRMISKGQSPYTWRLPGVFTVGDSSIPSSRWSREFVLHGDGPNLSSPLSYADWQGIDNQLRRNTPTPFKDFDALCSRLRLPARRGSPQSSFSLSAELPARLKTVNTDSGKGSLEIDIECIGAPELMIEWLPEHELQRVPPGWRREPTGDHHHVSLSVPGGATKADLLISFGELDADTRIVDVVSKQATVPDSAPRSVRAQAHERWKGKGKTLGEGGQAQVSIVEDTRNEYTGQWALKRLKNIDDPKAKERFGQEVKAVQSINHPNILRIIDSDLTVERPYFVAEYCEHGSLSKIGASVYKGDIAATREVVLPILDALVAAHKAGVFHRDVKPANILIRGDGTPVIGDFGICFVEGGQHFTLSNEGVGSRNFIAPEMESGQHHLGEPSNRTDVYSLGKVIYWMLSGGNEFAREDCPSLVGVLKDQRFEHVHRLLEHMVVRDPAKRIQSHQVKEKLEMTFSLVEGDFAPLTPSIGIRCRFCGVGSYERAFTYGENNSYSYFGLPAANQTVSKPGGETALLRCAHCGHIEFFQLKGIACKGWWDR